MMVCTLVIHVGELLRCTDLNHADCSFLRVGKAVRYERIDAFAACILVEDCLEDSAAAGGDTVRLHTRERMLRIAVRIYAIEHGTDDMEITVEVRACVDNE